MGYCTELISDWASVMKNDDLAMEAACLKKDWSSRKAGCLTCIAVGGSWSQARLYEAGFVDSAICTACNATGNTPLIGTDAHRTWVCDALKQERLQGIDPELVREAREEIKADPHHPFWAYGLMPKSWLPLIEPSHADHMVW